MNPQTGMGSHRYYSKNYAEHRRKFGEHQAEKVRIRKVKRELIKLFAEIFS